MLFYAQSILQLYGQLQRHGYSEAEISRIRDAYELAMALFTGRFQYSGKSFMAHVVGTASILCSVELPAPVVAAGLLHNVYEHGDFGDGSSGISKSKREEVRRIVGKEVEEYLAGFAVQRWNSQTITAIRNGLDALGPTDRSILLIRLADQLEHNLDLGFLYCNQAEEHQRFIQSVGPVMAEMAAKLGFSVLAAELSRTFNETVSAEIPEQSLRTPRSRSFVIVPESYRLRLAAALRPRLRRELRRLRSTIAAKVKRRPGIQELIIRWRTREALR